jgi:hypothetical protein
MSNRAKNPSSHGGQGPSRRAFLKSAGAAALGTGLVPAILQSAETPQSGLPIVGSGEHTYEVTHNWGELPSHVRWGDTHGVVFDGAGFLYITHQSHAPEPMDAIVVFDPAGKSVRSFGKEYHGGGHGLDLRKEGSEEFLYLSDVKNRQVVKLTLRGEQVWKRSYPEEAKVYQKQEQFCPTNVAFAPDGGFYVGDGYGSHYVHQFDKDAKWVRTWGGEGSEPGKLRTPHGLWWDNRPGRTASLVVADRANSRLQYFTADGQHLGFVNGLSFPDHFDIRGDELLVPDLHSRVSILDRDNKVVVHLGYDQAWTDRVRDEHLRDKPDAWQPGRFVHPHDACFDKDGNIFLVEWVPIGRVSKLRRVG